MNRTHLAGTPLTRWPTPRLRVLLAGRAWALAIALIVLAGTGWSAAHAQTRLTRLMPQTLTDLRAWDHRADAMARSGELKLRRARQDAMLVGRSHERLDQYHQGVRVVGGDIARQLDRGQTVSLFGTLYSDITVDPTPRLSPEQARERVEDWTGASVGRTALPELVVLPTDQGTYALTYRVRAFARGDLRVYFVDAHSGGLVLDYSELETQAAVGTAYGVLNDLKKLSVSQMAGTFVASDELRPPSLQTFDMDGNLDRTVDVIEGLTALGPADLASDSDNDWTDPAVVDAHANAGFTYDYLFKRFGRRGLDDADIAVVNLTHPVLRKNYWRYDHAVIATFYLNAFYAGQGVMVYGEGLPPKLTINGQHWNYLAGALDVVAHELAHGVTDYSSQLIYRGESGALSEAFSDIIGVGAEFFFQPQGTGPLKAEYLVAEDVVTPGGIRSLANPGAFGNPDHYSRRVLDKADNGGVHMNSTIVSHVFYLAIEGGINRTSELSVDGVGGANREQIERVFYRAFTEMLPSAATFSVARATTLQAARDLYGAGSAAERALRQAWTACGVE